MSTDDQPRMPAPNPADVAAASYFADAARRERRSWRSTALTVVLTIAGYSVAQAAAVAWLGEPDITRVTVSGCLVGPVVVLPADVTIDSAEAMRDEIETAAPGRWCEGLEPRAVRVGDVP